MVLSPVKVTLVPNRSGRLRRQRKRFVRRKTTVRPFTFTNTTSPGVGISEVRPFKFSSTASPGVGNLEASNKQLSSSTSAVGKDVENYSRSKKDKLTPIFHSLANQTRSLQSILCDGTPVTTGSPRVTNQLENISRGILSLDNASPKNKNSVSQNDDPLLFESPSRLNLNAAKVVESQRGTPASDGLSKQSKNVRWVSFTSVASTVLRASKQSDKKRSRSVSHLDDISPNNQNISIPSQNDPFHFKSPANRSAVGKDFENCSRNLPQKDHPAFDRTRTSTPITKGRADTSNQLQNVADISRRLPYWEDGENHTGNSPQKDVHAFDRTRSIGNALLAGTPVTKGRADTGNQLEKGADISSRLLHLEDGKNRSMKSPALDSEAKQTSSIQRSSCNVTPVRQPVSQLGNVTDNSCREDAAPTNKGNTKSPSGNGTSLVSKGRNENVSCCSIGLLTPPNKATDSPHDARLSQSNSKPVPKSRKHPEVHSGSPSKSTNNNTVLASPREARSTKSTSCSNVLTSTPLPRSLRLPGKKACQPDEGGLYSVQEQESFNESRISFLANATVGEAETNRNQVEQDKVAVDFKKPSPKDHRHSAQRRNSFKNERAEKHRNARKPFLWTKDLTLANRTRQENSCVSGSEDELSLKRKNTDMIKARKRQKIDKDLGTVNNRKSKLDTDIGVFLNIFRGIIDEFSERVSTPREKELLKRFSAIVDKELQAKIELLSKYHDCVKQTKLLSNVVNYLSEEVTNTTIQRLRMESRVQRCTMQAENPVNKNDLIQDFIESMKAIAVAEV